MSDETTMPEMPVRITTPDTSDVRLISDMRFGVNYSPAETIRDAQGNIISKVWEPTPEQEQEQAWVREYLAKSGCVYARDIETLGCTGVAKLAQHGAPEVAIAVGTRLRLGLGGGGVGLPCFVPPNLFCLVHNTIGGLQDHQKQLHSEMVGAISRELTPQERIQVGLTDKARRMRGGDRTTEAMDVLSGQNQDVLAEVAESLEDAHDERVLEESKLDDSGPVPFVPLKAWKCAEHTTTNWACRYCLAQAVVEGPLVPTFIARDDLSVALGVRFCAVTEIPGEIVAAEQSMAKQLQIFVRVATFTRKLARD